MFSYIYSIENNSCENDTKKKLIDDNFVGDRKKTEDEDLNKKPNLEKKNSKDLIRIYYSNKSLGSCPNFCKKEESLKDVKLINKKQFLSIEDKYLYVNILGEEENIKIQPNYLWETPRGKFFILQKPKSKLEVKYWRTNKKYLKIENFDSETYVPARNLILRQEVFVEFLYHLFHKCVDSLYSIFIKDNEYIFIFNTSNWEIEGCTSPLIIVKYILNSKEVLLQWYKQNNTFKKGDILMDNFLIEDIIFHSSIDSALGFTINKEKIQAVIVKSREVKNVYIH